MSRETPRLALDETPPFQSEPGTVRWKIHFRSRAAAVYEALATDDGRRSFWVDHRVDLRSHDPQRTWWSGFADN